MPTFPHERLRGGHRQQPTDDAAGRRTTSPLPWTDATFHDATPTRREAGQGGEKHQDSDGASPYSYRHAQQQQQHQHQNPTHRGEPLMSMPGHTGSLLLSPMQVGAPTTARPMEQQWQSGDQPPSRALGDAEEVQHRHNHTDDTTHDLSLQDVGSWALATPFTEAALKTAATESLGAAAAAGNGEQRATKRGCAAAAHRSSAEILFAYAAAATDSTPQSVRLVVSPNTRVENATASSIHADGASPNRFTPPPRTLQSPAGTHTTATRTKSKQQAAAAAAVQATGLNDPLLQEALHDAIFDRQVVEQLLILCDESSSRETLGLQCALERRSFLLAFAVRDHHLRTELLHRDILDEMMLSYTTGDHVPAVTHALGQRIDVAKAELKEVEEAVQAVSTRTDDETAAAEDELVRVLSAIREERQQLMAQVRWAEEQRALTFEREKDVLISKNYHHVPFSVGKFSTAHAQRNRRPATAASATEGDPTRPWFAEPGGSALLGLSSSSSSPTSKRVAPRDLWVSKTLPSVQREMDPSLVIGDQSDAVRTIESVFPLPPIPEDLELIQKNTPPPPHVSSRVSMSAALVAAATTSSRTTAPGHVATNPITYRRSVAENQQMAAAYYRSFLAVSNTNTNSSGGGGGPPTSLADGSEAPDRKSALATSSSQSAPSPLRLGDKAMQLSSVATVSSTSSASSTYPSSSTVVASLSKSLMDSSAALQRNSGGEGLR